MSDRQLLILARRMESHLEKALAIGRKLCDSNHPATKYVREVFEDNGLLMSWDVTEIVQREIDAPQHNPGCVLAAEAGGKS